MTVLKNAKHEAVAQTFFADPQRIGWKAYKVHYPRSSQRAAETGFSRLLKNAEFLARIAELDEAAAGAKVMELHEVLLELSRLGRSNLKHCLVGADNTADVVANIRDLPDEHAAAIQELTVDYYTEGRGDDAREVKRVKIKLHNKLGALSELRRHYEPQKHADPDGRPLGTGAAETLAENLTDLEIARRIAFALEKGAREAAAKAKKPKGKKQ